MSQNSVDYSLNPTGPELLDDFLDKDQENHLTCNSGIQRPTYAQAGTKWLDTSVTPWNFYMYDGAADVLIGTVNPTTHEFMSSNSANVVNLTDNQTIGGTKTFNGSVIVPDRTSGDNTTNAANTKFVTNAVSGLQPANTAVTHTSNTAVGSGVKPIYIANNGVATASNSTVGSQNTPVYLNGGTITATETSQVHVVIESYRNGYNWYRIYDDGWCEQGGVTSFNVNAETVTLHKEFLDTGYSVMAIKTYLTNTSSDTGGVGNTPEVSDYTTTSFRVSQEKHVSICTQWRAEGFIS